MSTMKDLQEFPAVYTFKVVGEKSEQFEKDLKSLFNEEEKAVNYATKDSSGGKYISYSVTTVVMDYEELEATYAGIKELKNLKFYV